MANEFVDIENALVTVFLGDSTLTALLGKIASASGATLNEALDTTETGVDFTGTAPVVNDVWLIDDEQMLVTAIAGSMATVTRAYNSTTAATHTTATAITKIAPAVEVEPRADMNTYFDGQLPVIALSCNSAEEDSEENETIGKFDTRYHIYMEIINQGMDVKTVSKDTKRIMAEIRRLVRKERTKSTPLAGNVDDIRIGSATMAVSTDKGRVMSWMFTHAEALKVINDTDL